MNDEYVIISSKGVISARDVCRMFGISESTLREWEKSGSIKSVKVDGLKKYKVREIDIMFRSMVSQGKSPPRIMPDWFYYRYEDPKFGKKIDTIKQYFEEFPYMEQSLSELKCYGGTSLSSYEFARISRPLSPLANHRVHFKAKKDHPLFSIPDVSEIADLTFEVSFETVTAKANRLRQNRT